MEGTNSEVAQILIAKQIKSDYYQLLERSVHSRLVPSLFGDGFMGNSSSVIDGTTSVIPASPNLHSQVIPSQLPDIPEEVQCSHTSHCKAFMIPST